MRDLEIDTDRFEREAVEGARLQKPTERLLDGLRLFDRTCEVMLAGIHAEQPNIDHQQALEILRSRLRLARDLES
jgi:hypothetical protein